MRPPGHIEYEPFKKSKYGATTIIKWLWKAWKGNRLQAFLNAALGIIEVLVSLASVWATQRAMDIAAGMIGIGENIRSEHFTLNALYWAVALMGGLTLCDFAVRISEIWVKTYSASKHKTKCSNASSTGCSRHNGTAKRHTIAVTY